MNYVRIDYKGNIQPIREECLTEFVSDDKGVVLIVTGEVKRSKELYEYLKEHIQPVKCSPRDLLLEKEHLKLRVASYFDWPSYMGLQLSSAYVHRDASIDFLFKILSKCRFAPS